jgi:hypothetical protein
MRAGAYPPKHCDNSNKTVVSLEDYIQAGEARKLKPLDDVKQRLGLFKEHFGGLPVRSVTANDNEACRWKETRGKYSEIEQGGKSSGPLAY